MRGRELSLSLSRSPVEALSSVHLTLGMRTGRSRPALRPRHIDREKSAREYPIESAISARENLSDLLVYIFMCKYLRAETDFFGGIYVLRIVTILSTYCVVDVIACVLTISITHSLQPGAEKFPVTHIVVAAHTIYVKYKNVSLLNCRAVTRTICVIIILHCSVTIVTHIYTHRVLVSFSCMIYMAKIVANKVISYLGDDEEKNKSLHHRLIRSRNKIVHWTKHTKLHESVIWFWSEHIVVELGFWRGCGNGYSNDHHCWLKLLLFIGQLIVRVYVNNCFFFIFASFHCVFYFRNILIDQNVMKLLVCHSPKH